MILIKHNLVSNFNTQTLLGASSSLGASLIISSILRIVIAASVANFKLLIFDIAGSRTPAFRLFLIFPLMRSSPECLSSFFYSSSAFWAALWNTLILAIKSVASLAAFRARVFGMTKRASENSAMANCSLDPRVLAKSSK